MLTHNYERTNLKLLWCKNQQVFLIPHCLLALLSHSWLYMQQQGVHKKHLVLALSYSSTATKCSRKFASNLHICTFNHSLNLSLTAKNLWQNESGWSYLVQERRKWSDFFSHSKQRARTWNWTSTRIRFILSFSFNSLKPDATYQYLSSHGWRANWFKNGLSPLLTLMAKQITVSVYLHIFSEV